MPQSNTPKARQTRARAARKAYKSVISDINGKDTGSEYSPKKNLATMNNKAVARRVGKQIVKSAARPGKVSNTIKYSWGGVTGKRVAKIGPKFDINFSKFNRAALVHASLGEVKGMERDIRQAYKKNLRKAKAKRQAKSK